MRKNLLITSLFLALIGGCLHTYEDTSRRKKDPYRTGETLSSLKWQMHIIEMDSSYDSDIDFLKHDLDTKRPKIDDSTSHFWWEDDNPMGIKARLRGIEEKHSSRQATLLRMTQNLNNIEGEISEHEKTQLAARIAHERQRMPKRGQTIIELKKKIKAIEERFAVDKKRYELKKQRYQEHLVKGILANGISRSHIYSDNRVVIYVDSIRVRKDTVILRLKTYLVKPSSQHSINTKKCDTHISIYNPQGENLGSPIEIRSTNHNEAKGATIDLAYEGTFELGEGYVKLVIEKNTLHNEKEVVMEMPYILKEITPPRLPSTRRDIVSTLSIESEKDFVKRIETITGKRRGNHLIVRVSLNIHGKEIETEMMLDTGASVTTIPFGLYKKGNAKPLSELKREKFETAKGIIQSYIDEVQVSTSAYSKTITVAISNYDTALLGANYFEGNVFTVDVDNECIYVHPRPE